MPDQAKPEPPQDELLTVEEIAGRLKVPVSWVYKHTQCRNGDRIPHFKAGKYLRFRESEVLAWLQRSLWKGN